MRRRVDLSDWTRFKGAGGPRLEPGSGRVAFSVMSSNIDENRNESRLWLWDPASAVSRVLTAGPLDRGAVWHPDGGRVAYIGKYQDKSAVFVVDADTGEARRISDALDGLAEVCWRPGGDTLTVLAFKMTPESSVADLASALGPDTFAAQADTGLRLTARYPFRFDGVGYYDARRRHLAEIGEDGGVSWLTEGEFDVTAYAWHPNGRQVIYARATDPQEMHGETLIELAPGSGERPFVDAQGDVVGLSWSPDGRYLAWVGDDNAYGWGTENHLWLADAQGESIHNVTKALDRQMGEVGHGDVQAEERPAVPAWSPDSRTLYVEYNDRGLGRILAVDVASGAVRSILGDDWQGTARNPDANGTTVVFAGEDFSRPSELYQAEVGGGAVQRLSHLNDAVLNELELGDFEGLAIERAGFRIEGWVGKPPEFSSGKTYPLIMYIHGGPHGAFSAVFRHEYHWELARGRMLVFVNPRGSQGYGQEFARACMTDWGGEDYQDLMASLDEVLTRYPVDARRLGVTGISYGGYMTNWVIGHTGRFAAAVAEMSVSNHLSMYTHSDIGVSFMQSEFASEPWQDWERLWERSPIRYVDAVTTPTLFIAGAEDHRCPPEQTEAMYVGLLKHGVDTAYVRFPGAAHGFSRVGPPAQRLERRRLMAQWWDRYLGEK